MTPTGAAPRTVARTVLRAGRDAARRAAWPVGSAVSVRGAGASVVLTYDDGPEPGGTDRVLAALHDADVRATFFVLLTRARRFPRLLAEVVAAGHEIGLHGIDHRPLTSFGPSEARRRTADGRAELEDRIASPVRWFRPPYGRQRLPHWAAVRAAGLMPVLWGPSSADALDAPFTERVERATAGVGPGAILLGHDGFAGPEDGAFDGPAPVFDRGALAAAVIARYRERGIEPVTLGDALETGTLRRAALFVR